MSLPKHDRKTCFYCRQAFDDDRTKTKDHVVAKSRGGFNTLENYVDCCFTCNQWKADKTLIGWLRQVEESLKRGKHRYYTKTQMGQIVGNIRKLLAEMKNRKDVSTHKIE